MYTVDREAAAMNTRKKMLRAFADDIVERALCDEVEPSASHFDHLESSEASLWLDADDAPWDAPVTSLVDGIDRMSLVDRAGLARRITRLLDGDLTLTGADELLSLLRSAIVDDCKADIRGQLDARFDLAAVADATVRDRALCFAELSREQA
jgi:hypothetical protein